MINGARENNSWVPVLSILVVILVVASPSWKLGLVSDDLLHLIGERRQWFAKSSVGLYRPIGGFLVSIGEALFGQDPIPYRIAMTGLYLLDVVILYGLTFHLGGGRVAATVAGAVFGFFPRNHQALFWNVSSQDLIVGASSLMVFSFFLKYRDSGKRRDYVIALLMFLFALGVKETAFVILPMLFLIEMYRRQRLRDLASLNFWRAYLPFGAGQVSFLLYFFASGGLHNLHRGGAGSYSFQGVTATLKHLCLLVVNLLSPFSRAIMSLRQLTNPGLALSVFLGASVALGLALAVGRLNRSLLAMGWVFISLLPVAAFGGWGYQDRYLFVPFMGVAFLFGFAIEAVVPRAEKHCRPVGTIVFGLLAIYLSCSILRLDYYRRQWGDASREVEFILSETTRLHPQVPKGGTFYYVNLPHSRLESQIGILNNGLSGALWTRYRDHSVKAIYCFSSADPHQQDLTTNALMCPTGDNLVGRRSADYVLVYKDGELYDRSGACADLIIKKSVGKIIWYGKRDI